MTEPTTCTVPVEFLRGVIALCTQRGYSPENIEAWSKDDKWVADLWRQAEQMLAIAKWGTPAPVGVEPYGRITTHSVTGQQFFYRWPESPYLDNASECVSVYTTPQPTQTQAGAVPLTCEWTHNDDDGFWETACGEAWRFDDGGPGENNMHFCHSCGKTLRIKGGQHGAE